VGVFPEPGPSSCSTGRPPSIAAFVCASFIPTTFGTATRFWLAIVVVVVVVPDVATVVVVVVVRGHRTGASFQNHGRNERPLR